MRVALSFITATAPVSRPGSEGDLFVAAPQLLTVVGYDPVDGKVYLLEGDEAGDELPLLSFMHTRGAHAGRIVAVRSAYDGADSLKPAELELLFWRRLERLSRRLRPMVRRPNGLYRSATRVIRKRAVRLDPDAPPIRKYTLRVMVMRNQWGSRPAHTLVTAYLRPRASLHAVYRVPDGDAEIAIVRYTGVPVELGYDTDVAVLLPPDRDA